MCGGGQKAVNLRRVWRSREGAATARDRPGPREAPIRDLRAFLKPALQAAARTPARTGSRVVVCLAAEAGAGTSSVAASLGLLAQAHGARRVWLQELALGRNALYRALQDVPFRDVGPPGRAYRGAPEDARPFVRRSKRGGPASVPGPDESGLLCVHPLGDTVAVVSRIRTECLAQGERLAYRHDPAWWDHTRRLADWIIVDAPDASRSDAGLAALPEADGVLLVARADRTETDRLAALTATLRDARAPLLGLVVNAVARDAARFTGWGQTQTPAPPAGRPSGPATP